MTTPTTITEAAALIRAGTVPEAFDFTADLLGDLAADLEGRLDNLADDGLGDSPTAEDVRHALDAVNAAWGPLRREDTGAEAWRQIALSVENLDDYA